MELVYDYVFRVVYLTTLLVSTLDFVDDVE
jgi:hypothetical protein